MRVFHYCPDYCPPGVYYFEAAKKKHEKKQNHNTVYHLYQQSNEICGASFDSAEWWDSCGGVARSALGEAIETKPGRAPS